MTLRSYETLVQRIEAAAQLPDVRCERIGEFGGPGGRTFPLFILHLGRPAEGRKNVMMAAGIHGDEPAGVEAAMRFVETNSGNEELLSQFSFVVFPCNNPTGWELDSRENWKGIDLNRQFATRKQEPEAEIITRALQGQCFDVVFEMHEDVDSPGFYLYEIAENSDYHVGERIIQAVADAGMPVNLSECIEGLPAAGGLIRRSVKVKKFRKTRLPQAIYAYRTCGGHVLTLEPPASVLPLEERVWIELKGLEIVLEATAAAAGRSQG